MITEKWYKRARLFILEQKQSQLTTSIARYPNSPEYARRRMELAEIESEINALNEVEQS